MVRIIESEVPGKALETRQRKTRDSFHSQVLKDLRIPEAFAGVKQGRCHIVNVIETGKPAGGLKERVEAVHGAGGAVEVLRITGHAVCVEVRLEDFRTLNIIGGSDVIPVLLVKEELTRGDCIASSKVSIG